VRSIDARSEDLFNLNLASNLLVANWGNTDPYKSLFFGVPVVTMLFPDDTDARVAAGYPNGVPPIVGQDAKWGVTGAMSLRVRLAVVKNNENYARLITANKRAAPFRSLLIPGAEERIADEVMKYLQ
jgi:hypothetical protein